MVAVKNVTNDVSLLFRPIGFSTGKDKKATIEEIRKWKEKEKPNFIKGQSYLSLGGIIAAAIGVVVGLTGLKKDSRLMKWLGGLLTVFGIGSSGIGILKTDSQTTIIGTSGKKIEGKDNKDKIQNAIAIIKNDKSSSIEEAQALSFLLKTGESEALKVIEDLIKDKTKDVEARGCLVLRVARSETQKELAKTLLINIIQEASLETSLIEYAAQSLLGSKDLELTKVEKESAKKALIRILNNDSLKPRLRTAAMSALGRYFKASEVLSELKEASGKITGNKDEIRSLKRYVEDYIEIFEQMLREGLDECQS